MKKTFAMLLLSVSIFLGWKNIADAKEVGTISHSDLTLEVVQSDDGMKGGISPATGIYQKKLLYENSIFIRIMNSCQDNFSDFFIKQEGVYKRVQK